MKTHLHNCPTHQVIGVVTIFVLLFAIPIFASNSVPRIIGYQGKLLDNSGQPLSGIVDLRFAIYDAETEGEELWFEDHSDVEITDGLLNLILGYINHIADSVFQDSVCYLGVKVGDDPEMHPRSRLASVPYAYRVATIDNAAGGQLSGNLTLLPDGTSGAFIVRGNGADTVMIDPGNNYALYVTDASGHIRLLIEVTPIDCSISSFDPVDELKSFAPNAIGNQRFKISNTGVVLYGETVADTTVLLKPNGNVTGRGRLTMGLNSSGSESWATVLGFNNTADGDSSTIGGGHDNTASGIISTISGGAVNTAIGEGSTIGGGVLNETDSALATIAGGWRNIGGGMWTAICGGVDNEAKGDYAVIAGGRTNTTSASYACVPGGQSNAARATHSISLGNRAKALHAGTTVITANSPSSPADSVYTSGIEQLVIRADSGIYIMNSSGAATYDPTKLINTSTGGYLSSGGNWVDVSDRNLKENFETLNGAEIIDLIDRLPISKWNYKAEQEHIKHIGPTAQDFHALFGIGYDDKSIASRDLAGLALAAIQELSRRSQELENKTARIEALEKRLAKLEQLVKQTE